MKEFKIKGPVLRVKMLIYKEFELVEFKPTRKLTGHWTDKLSGLCIDSNFNSD